MRGLEQDCWPTNRSRPFMLTHWADEPKAASPFADPGTEGGLGPAAGRPDYCASSGIVSPQLGGDKMCASPIGLAHALS
jgi:hypothetical protein